MSLPVATLPLAPTLTRSRNPVPTSALCTVIRPSASGVPTWSANSSGAAPVPPSAPSTTMKSGVTPSLSMALHTARNCRREVRHSLKPVGLPPASSRIRPMNRTSSRGVENTRWYGGDTTVCPCGTSRTFAISALTLLPGSTPPMPGFAPCDSFRETHFTWSWAAFSANMAASKSPSSVRHPKYPVPISQIRSPPWRRWYSKDRPHPCPARTRPGPHHG